MRMSHLATGIVIVVTPVLLATASTQLPPGRRLPPPGTMATRSATQVISPVALVTWVAKYGSDGVSTIDLIVLWRGMPGWFSRGSSNGVSSGGSTGSFHSTIRYGGLDLQLELDSQARVAQVQGTRVDLGDSNVILVDGVDMPGGPVVVATLRVEPDLPQADNGYPRIEEVLRRSPQIVSYLGCDERLPDGLAQKMIDIICARIIAR
jgi:hypothetical protein